MKSRREFFKSVAAAGALGAVGVPSVGSAAQTAAPAASGNDDRAYWLSVLQKLANPVLGNLSKRELKMNMPVEAANPADRRRFTHLEAFGRLLAGTAPWLEASGLT